MRDQILQRVRVYPDDPAQGMTYLEIVNSFGGKFPATILFDLRQLVDEGALKKERPSDGGPYIYSDPNL